MDNDNTFLGERYYAYYYRTNVNYCYITVGDGIDFALLTPSEALTLLNWLQERRSNIEALQEQENTK